MSEGAIGGEVQFVRLFFPEFGNWLESYQEIGSNNFNFKLTNDEKKALVLVSPTAATLKKIGDRLGEVEPREVSYAEWIESGEPKTRP